MFLQLTTVFLPRCVTFFFFSKNAKRTESHSFRWQMRPRLSKSVGLVDIFQKFLYYLLLLFLYLFFSSRRKCFGFRQAFSILLKLFLADAFAVAIGSVCVAVVVAVVPYFRIQLILARNRHTFLPDFASRVGQKRVHLRESSWRSRFLVRVSARVNVNRGLFTLTRSHTHVIPCP